MPTQPVTSGPILIRLISVSACVALLLLTASLVWLLQVMTAVSVQERDHLQGQRLCGRLTHLDALSEMSARMHVASGNPKWEVCYDAYLAELDHAEDGLGLLQSGTLHHPNCGRTSCGD